MRILIDIDELEKSGTVSLEQATELREHAIKDSSSLAINVLLAFGSIAVAVGILGVYQSAHFGAFFGIASIIFGFFFKILCPLQWKKLASIWMVIGALVLCGSLGIITNQPLVASLLSVAIFAIVSVMAGSGLLISLVPLCILSAMGGYTGYWHACYLIVISEPTLTIVVFSILAFAAWECAKVAEPAYERLAIVFARTCVFLVNLAFWIGSLWGDTPGRIWSIDQFAPYISPENQQLPAMYFVISWAIVLIIAGVWAARHGYRFLLNIVVVFGAIEFYTQWFEFIGIHPTSILIAGVVTVLLGFGLWYCQQKMPTSELLEHTEKP